MKPDFFDYTDRWCPKADDICKKELCVVYRKWENESDPFTELFECWHYKLELLKRAVA